MVSTSNGVPTIWTTGWTNVLTTGTWRSLTPVYEKRLSPCSLSCPVNGDIPVWINQIEKENYLGAWHTLVAKNPLPAITGRVCHHPCEGTCNRAEYDENISIQSLERFVADLALRKGWELPIRNLPGDKKIAVVGGGPAGLSAAYQLRLRGYKVTILEARNLLGGMLRYGIPDYRLPKDILNQEIERLLQIGLEVQTGSPINKLEDYRELKKEYDVLFLATGAQKSRVIPELKGHFFEGLQFLAMNNEGKQPRVGARVAVIGGGNTAVDAARTARRLDAGEVTIIYRRDREQMPAQEDEIIAAEEEGIKLSLLAVPVEIENVGKSKKIICQRTRLGSPDQSGRARPEPIPGAYFTLHVDTVISALGSEPDLSGLGNRIDVNNRIIKTDQKQATSEDGVFAGGDVASLERFVSAAIGAGKKAAQGIACYLGATGEAENEEKEPVTFPEINTFYFPSLPGLKKTRINPLQRLQNFQEVQPGISQEEAIQEARRCFKCGFCVECDNCFYFCPDMAIKKEDSGGYFLLEQYCKGCGLCVEECPRGAIVLREEIK